MRYQSTRGGVTNVDFSDVVFQNYASDGGLFVPESIPRLSRDTLRSWSSLSYQALCVQVLSLFVNDTVRRALASIVAKAYTASDFASEPLIPLRSLSHVHVLELFHGRSLSFKDFSLNLVAQTMQHLLSMSSAQCRRSCATILVHTHGDTGPAAASSVALLGRRSRCKVLILYPRRQCSQVQHEQMASAMQRQPASVRVYATDKDMDAQRDVVQRLLRDTAFVRRFNVCGMNSINFVRILGQTVYYVFAYLRLQPACEGAVDVAVPSGAFGNTLGCALAKRMGVRIRSAITGF